MTSPLQPSRVSRFLAPLLALAAVCGLALPEWQAIRRPDALLNPRTAQADDGSLWEVVGPNIPLLRESGDQEQPAIAYNSQANEYLVVWQDKRNLNTTRTDIYGRRVGADGLPLGDEFFVSRQAENQDSPHVVYNSTQNQYLVVWSDQRNVSSNGSDVYGQRISADGNLLGNDIAISTALRPQLYPRVAYNPDAGEYLVVWQDSRTTSTTSSDIYGQRVAGDGTLRGSPIVISNDRAAQNQPDVAYSPASQRYLVAWDDERNAIRTDVDLYAQLVTGAGTLDGTNFALSMAARDQANAGIVYNAFQKEFLVYWEDSRQVGATSIDIYGQRVDAAGNLRGNNLPLSSETGAEEEPALAYSSGLNGYLLVWRDDTHEPGTGGDIFGRALNDVGEPLGDEFEIAVATGIQRQPQLAYNTSNGELLVIWQDSRNLARNGNDIYGQRMGPRVQPTATPTHTATAPPTETATTTSTPTMTTTASATATATDVVAPTSTPTSTKVAGPTQTPSATPIPPNPTKTPAGYPGPSNTPVPGGRSRQSYLPVVRRDAYQPCGFEDPDNDEPANNLWESATPYGYGRWNTRTFWDPSAPSGQAGSDIDWYEWVVEWTGTHWIWPENTTRGVEVYAEVFFATGDARRPLELLAYGRGRQEIRLEAGKTYYVKIKNVSGNPPAVGCYDLILDP